MSLVQIGKNLPDTGSAECRSGFSHSELLSIRKPAQYLGDEFNSINKDPESVDCHFALCFPDTYEVGMSHLGLQILYHIINADPHAWAERVFMPESDMEDLLRSTNRSLSSLEAGRALAAFDVVGFSLQYELCATNILAMLELGGISRRSSERSDQEPIVIGGGPYSYHPEPLTPFFDAFLLGDAEEAIAEVLEVVRGWKASPAMTREEKLLRLAAIEGVYLPRFYQPQNESDGRIVSIDVRPGLPSVVTRRLLPTMVGAPYPRKPIVPNIKTVHNRLSVEVMRGCVRGCRFCQAGYLYRPQRERSPEEIQELIREALPESGFEEVSLLSLSTADYCSIVPLLKSLMDSYGEGDKLSISFPSTRVDALTPEVLEQVQRVRRTGFTVAPEGGSQRLRDVINKGVSDEQILQTASNVFRMGWSGIKLYFMLGLPTETDQDLLGIVDIARRMRALPEAKGKTITVSVSTHVPKPHTPFQWAAQITPTETIRRQRLLAEGLRDVGVQFRYHDSFSSFLEGVFCRGDRQLSQVIERAYELGCRLDAWQESLDPELWMQAFQDCNIDPNYYLRERTLDEVLPWEHLSCGISKDYFAREYRRALRDKTTADCLKHSCSICGACDYDVRRNILWPVEQPIAPAVIEDSSGDIIFEARPVISRLRVRYRMHGALRYLGHLESAHIWQRACRRGSIPLAYSGGYHPLPKIIFGPPLSLGVASEAEYVDLYLDEAIEAEEVQQRLGPELPAGVALLSVWPVSLQAPSIQDSIVAHAYRVRCIEPPAGLLADAFARGNFDYQLLQAVNAMSIRRSKKPSKRGRSKRSAGEHQWLLGDFLIDPRLIESNRGELEFHFGLRVAANTASIKPTEVMQALANLGVAGYDLVKLDSVFADCDGASSPSCTDSHTCLENSEWV